MAENNTLLRHFFAPGADADPEGDGKDYLECLNPDSLSVLTGCKVEQGLAQAALPEAGKTATSYQFMRQGYFCVDKDSTPDNLIINRTVALNSSWDKKKK